MSRAAAIRPPAPVADLAAERALHRWRRRYRYYYSKLNEYLRFIVPEGESVLLLRCDDGDMLHALRPARAVGIDAEPEMIAAAGRRHPEMIFHQAQYHRFEVDGPFEYVILNDMCGDVYDLSALLNRIAALCTPTSRVVIVQHNYLWRPLLRLAGRLGLKRPEPPQNWLSPGDLQVFLYAAGFETVAVHHKLFMPVSFMGAGRLINAALGVLPFCSRLASTQILVARLLPDPRQPEPGSCTVVLTTRNERENIEPMVKAIPRIAADTEILFVEGHSTDGTRQEIARVIDAYPEKNIRLLVQSGEGQGDAIRLGFREARGDIVVLLEADQTSPAADVRQAWEVIAAGRADYVNGSRFIYPRARGAMPAGNTLGNYLFAAWFTWFLGQRTSDVLCGLKAISKAQFRRLERQWGFLGVSDPFGDFELIFGAARLGLRICEVPTRYHPRQHGHSKTRLLKHGCMLLRMAWAATLRFKCR